MKQLARKRDFFKTKIWTRALNLPRSGEVSIVKVDDIDGAAKIVFATKDCKTKVTFFFVIFTCKKSQVSCRNI